MKLFSILTFILILCACSNEPTPTPTPMTLPSIEKNMGTDNPNRNNPSHTSGVMTSKRSIMINGQQKSTCTCTMNGKKVTVECEGSDCYCDTDGDEPVANCCEGADCPDGNDALNPFDESIFDDFFQPREPEIPGFEEEETNQNKKI